MKLIEREQAALIVANENFVCVDEDTNKYELDGIAYMYTDGVLLEIEEDTMNEADLDMESISEEALVDTITSEVGL